MQNLGAKSFTPITVMKLVRKMPGGSQPFLVECEDRKHYILKLNGNPQGPNLLANEFIGSHVGRAVGLPMSEAIPLLLTPTFVNHNPSLAFATSGSQYQPDPGIHLGTFFQGAMGGPDRVIQLIKPRDVERITNLGDFLGMYLLDVWSLHQDRREALFVSHTEGKRVRKAGQAGLFGIFIDNGHLFCGPTWQDTPKKFTALHLERSIYKNLWSAKAVRKWVGIFQKTIPRALSSVLPVLPLQWYSGDLNKLSAYYLSRLAQLPEVLEAYSLEKEAIEASLLREDIWLAGGWSQN